MPQQQMLRVMANPYAAELDHEGRCHGHLQHEPDVVNGDASLRFIGCRVVAVELRKADPKIQLSDDHDHAWMYDVEPTSVPLTAYYLRALRHLDIFPADAESHALAFGGPGGFIDPVARIAQLARERKMRPEPAKDWGPILDAADSKAASASRSPRASTSTSAEK
jgi:hypothetical protein